MGARGPVGGHRARTPGDAVAAGRQAGRAPDARTSRRCWRRPAWRARSSRRRSRAATGSTRATASCGARRWRGAASSCARSASRSGRTGRWPGGTPSSTRCTSSVLYARVSIGQRVGLHLRTGERLERGYGERAGEIAGELAMHFEHGRDFERAARYRRQAGEHALRQHGYREAADHATRALDVLGPCRSRRSAPSRSWRCRSCSGAALTATQGPRRARGRAGLRARPRAVRRRWAKRRSSFRSCWASGGSISVRASSRRARDVGMRLLAMAEATGDAALLLAAHNALGIVSLLRAASSRRRSTIWSAGSRCYDPAAHSPTGRALCTRLVPPASPARSTPPGRSGCSGYPDRAAARTREALALARSLDHPFGVSYACHFAAAFHRWRGESRVVARAGREALAHDRSTASASCSRPA